MKTASIDVAIVGLGYVGLPLCLAAPLFGLLLNLPETGYVWLIVSLIVGTPALSVVGTFGAAIGLKGEIKINLLTSNFEVFKSLERYYNFDQSTEWKFDFIKMRNDKCVAFPSHCKNRDDAENLKNQKIFASKDKFPKTKSNEYYVDDLIGCNVVHKNQTFIGNVISVDNFGAGDLLEINFKENKIYIPLNDDNVISVDIENKKILVNPIKGIIDNA